MKHYTYHIQVFSKENSDNKYSFWFQNGKLTYCPDTLKNYSSTKHFRNKNKAESFLRWLNKNFPDTVVQVSETRPDKRIVYDIQMGDINA